MARQKDAVVLTTLLTTLFIAALDFSAITTALPSISRTLQSRAATAWISSAYLLTSAAISPIWGRMSDLWGRKCGLVVAVAIFFVGSLVCALSKSTAVLLAGRAIQGSGAGGIIVGVNICISAQWQTRSRGLFLSTTGLVWALSSGLGPLLGGALSEYLSWRWIFWINLPVCGAALLILVVFLDSAEQASTQAQVTDLDWPGSIAIVGAAIMVLLSLDLGGTISPWNSPKVIGSLLGGTILLILFFLWEARGAKEPIVPVRLFNSWSRAAPLLLCAAHGFVNMSSWFFLPIYFQAVLGASPTRSGALLLPIVLVQACAGVLAGAFIHRFGSVRGIIRTGAAIMTLAFGLFGTLDSSTSIVVISILEVVAGIGVGLIFQAPLIVYQSLVDENDINVATALFGFMRSLSTAISIVLGEVVFQNGMRTQQRKLDTALRPWIANNFTATSAASNALQVHRLPAPARELVEQAYVRSFKEMWILYTTVAGIGLVIGITSISKLSLPPRQVTIGDDASIELRSHVPVGEDTPRSTAEDGQ